MRPRTHTRLTTPATPHSWAVDQWTEVAPGVFPGTTPKARWLIRAHRTELLDAGALVRVGRQLVIMGHGYGRWLAQQGFRVPGHVPAPNRTAQDDPARKQPGGATSAAAKGEA